jgi:hypothetical protein
MNDGKDRLTTLLALTLAHTGVIALGLLAAWGVWRLVERVLR